MSIRELIIEGVRQNNLKNISLRLPHNSVIAVTGVSGSGKSSLAFDTIFAEGQWRFIESLSTYARLFIEKLDRPDIDAIENVRPAVALEQKNPVKGSRSTVGTLTEIYDLFRVLFSRVSTPHCDSCAREIRKWDPSAVVADLLERHSGQRAAVVFPSGEPLPVLRHRGFIRLWSEGGFVDLQESGPTDGPPSGKVEVVLDRLVIRDESRLSDSIETAWREGGGQLKVILFTDPDRQEPGPDKAEERSVLRYSAFNSCDYCGLSLPDPAPIVFSFNHPVCACPECKGFGNVLLYNEDLLVPDRDKSLAGGAVDLWEKPGYRWWKDQMIKGLKKVPVDVHKPFSALTSGERDILYNGAPSFFGINDFFKDMENKRYKLHVRVLLSRYRSPVACPSCGGKRLSGKALAYRIEGRDIADVSAMPLSELLTWISGLHLSPMQRDIAVEPLRQIEGKLRFLHRVGLDYLTLDRQAKTLSGGEYQRVNLSNQLASALTGTIYVLDEPTIGLHPRDTRRIAEIMRELSEPGNTVIVVEHDKDIISMCDWIVELGPGGGRQGGEVVFSGPVEEFRKADTLTSRYLREETGFGAQEKGGAFRADKAPAWLYLSGAAGHNLKSVSITLPLEALTVVTGVSGSGKSTLIVDTLYPAVARFFKEDAERPLQYETMDGLKAFRGVRLIDQGPIGKTPRSNPLTYLKIFEPIRKLFAGRQEAKAHGYKPGFFSFNIPGGRCETCKGEGYQKMEMYFFEDIYVHCEDCKGRRYGADALRVLYKGKSISDVLEMTVEEAFEFFLDDPEIAARFRLLREIGLGYLRLGQSANTLSGGEAQRLKICAELSSGKSGPGRGLLYILDEPTVGLHAKDVSLLMGILRRLVSAGNTVVVIEHNLDVISCADWAIDLGPEGGDQGGRVLFQGVPEGLAEAPDSHTGRFLKAMCYPK